MTLLTICQAIADEVGIDRPVTVAANTAPGPQKLLRMVNKVGKQLMKSYDWQVLRVGGTFTGLGQETQTSFIPADFDRFVPETVWDTTNNNMLVGPISPVEWNSLKAFSYNNTSRRKFIHRSNSILVIPIFSGSENIIFEYVSNQWCQSSGAVGQTAFAADTDTGILDEELLTRAAIVEYLATEGLPVGAAAGSFKEYLDLMTDHDNANTPILIADRIFGGGRHFDGAPNVNSFGIDTI